MAALQKPSEELLARFNPFVTAEPQECSVDSNDLESLRREAEVVRLLSIHNRHVNSGDSTLVDVEANSHRAELATASASLQQEELIPAHGALSSAFLREDLVISALCELVATRLGVSHVVFSLIGKAHWWLAGTNSTLLDPGYITKWLEDGNAPMAPMSAAPLKDMLCDHVLNLPVIPGRPAFLEVSDLEARTPWNQYLACTQLKFRFYSGIAVCAANGLRIGALTVLDKQSRPQGLSAEQRFLMFSIAQAFSGHLDLYSQRASVAKTARIGKAFSLLLEQTTSMVKSTTKKSLKKYQEVEDGAADLVSEMASPESVDSPYGLRANSAKRSKKPETSADHRNIHAHPLSPLSPGSEPLDKAKDIANEATPLEDPASSNSETSHMETLDERTIFTKAAKVICQALQIHDGGVMFLADSPSNTDAAAESRRLNAIDEAESESGQTFASNPSGKVYDAHDRSRLCEVLGRAIKADNSKEDQSTLNESLDRPQITQSVLLQIMQRYPKGQVWAIDAEAPEADTMHSQRKDNTKNLGHATHHDEYDSIEEAFPLSRSVMFIPLRSAGNSRSFVSCFVYSRSFLDIFDAEIDLDFMLALGNIAVSEILQLTNVALEKQKADFIGSISHELRSPLHGILASTEFLAETECDEQQRTLIETIENCGNVLLDTISHILQFSKINSVARSSKRKPNLSELSRGFEGSRITAAGSEKMQSRPEIFDVALLCEESVGVCLQGHSHRGISEGFPIAAHSKSTVTTPSVSTAPKTVKILLDFAEGDYRFCTIPSILRRIIMNIVGNSLKFTRQGYITVALKIQPPSDAATIKSGQEPATRLFIQVTDTGKGIGEAFLRNSLFSPYSQENPIFPGTGLGLSIVKGLVDMLDGYISIESEADRGTQVTIDLPLPRTFGGEAENDSNSTNSLAKPPNPIVAAADQLRDNLPSYSIGIYGLNARKGVNESSDRVNNLLVHYLKDWFGVTSIHDPLEMDFDVGKIDVGKIDVGKIGVGELDFIMVDDFFLLKDFTNMQFTNSVQHIVLTDQSVHGEMLPGMSDKVRYLMKPLGPYKLVSVLSALITGVGFLSPTRFTASFFDSPALRPKAGSSTPRHGSVIALKSPTEVPGDNGDSNAATSSSEHSTMITPWIDAVTSTAQQSGNAFEQEFEGQNKKDDESTHTDKGSVHTGMVARTPLNSSPGVNVGADRSRPRMLIVDDNETNLRLLKVFLSKRNCALVVEARNGLEAVQACEEQNFDICFMDLSMPIMDGIEATRQIRAAESDRRVASISGPSTGNEPPPEKDANGAIIEEKMEGMAISKMKHRSNHAMYIIALTGLANDKSRQAAFKAGTNIYMTKPVRFKDVDVLLNQWQDGKSP